MVVVVEEEEGGGGGAGGVRNDYPFGYADLMFSCSKRPSPPPPSSAIT